MLLLHVLQLTFVCLQSFHASVRLIFGFTSNCLDMQMSQCWELLPSFILRLQSCLSWDLGCLLIPLFGCSAQVMLLKQEKNSWSSHAIAFSIGCYECFQPQILSIWFVCFQMAGSPCLAWKSLSSVCCLSAPKRCCSIREASRNVFWTRQTHGWFSSVPANRKGDHANWDSVRGKTQEHLGSCCGCTRKV